MNARLKIIDKILPRGINNKISLSNVKNVNVSYKHIENTFVLDLTHNIGSCENELENRQHSSELLRFSVDRNIFIKHVLEGLRPKEKAANTTAKNVVIDFSSPNIAKPIHVGHLRSTIIGNFIANINRHFHNNVTKINYLGDWGTQFGLLQYGLKTKDINIDELHNNPIKTLYEVYVYANNLASKDDSVQEEARKYFADIEQGKADLENWKKIRAFTVQELEKIYHRLGIQFDKYHWESDYNGKEIKALIHSLENKGIIQTDNLGKKIAKVNNKDVTIIKSDNSTLYISRDIAALLDRYHRYNFDEMLYVVDNAQTDHFTALFEIVKQINSKCVESCKHIKFGRIKGMSTRRGNVVFLNDILDEAKEKMYEKQQQSKNTRISATNEETCDILGITAVVINDLKQRRQRDYIFDWNKALQSEGDSGIKLQYLHCRLWSLEQNSNILIPEVCDPKYLPEETIGTVVAELAKFEEYLHKSLNEYEACILLNYLFRLAKHVNRMFNELKVKGVENDVAQQRLLVFNRARQVIYTSLKILGVNPLYEM